MTAVRWTYDKYARLAEMLRSGATRDAMAQEFGVTNNAIHGATYRLKKRLGRSFTPPVETVEQKIIDRFKDGRAIDSIANVVGMKRADVSNILKDNGFSVDETPVTHEVHPMWGVDEYARRAWIAKRASKGAKKALKEMGAA